MPSRFAACPVESIRSLIIGSSSDHRRVMSSSGVYSPCVRRCLGTHLPPPLSSSQGSTCWWRNQRPHCQRSATQCLRLRASGRVLSVHQNRFRPESMRLKAMVQADLLGALDYLGVQCLWSHMPHPESARGVIFRTA